MGPEELHKLPTSRTEPGGSFHREREARLREVDVSSPDVQGDWTVWGLVLNPLVETYYIHQGPLLLSLSGNKC